ncbi:MAG TPA: hypothetical protein VIL49_06625, partial [Capillimicrobium sp.]
MSPQGRALLRSRGIALLWALGGLAPFVTIAWAIAEHGPIPPLPDGPYFGPFALSVPFVIVTLQFVPLAFVGAAITARPAPPPIGWAMLAVAAVSGVAGLVDRYAVQALLLDPGSLPAGEAAAVVANVLPRISHLVLGTLVLLLVPTGRLGPGFPRVVLKAAIAVGVLMVLRTLIVEGPLRGFALVDNPLAVAGVDPDAPWTLIPDVGFSACVAGAAWATWRAGDDRPEHRTLLRRIAVLAVLVNVTGGLLLRTGESLLVAVPAAMLLALLVTVLLFSARSHGLWALRSLLHRSVVWVIGTTVLVVAYAGIVATAIAASVELSTLQRLGAVVAAIVLATVAGRGTARALGRHLLADSADPKTALLRLLGALDAVAAPADAPQ